MQVNLYTQNNYTPANFKALKKVRGTEVLQSLIGDDGKDIVNNLTMNLKNNNAFDTLCRKYDVFVNISPDCSLIPNSLYLNKALLLGIYTKNINRGLFGFLKKNKEVPVCRYAAYGPEASTWDLAEYINKHYIKDENGLTKDIVDFLIKNN